MRCLSLVLLCLLISFARTEPEPKKYNKEVEDKGKQSLTKEERKFLREVEEKFGVKSDVPAESENDKKVDESHKKNSTETDSKPLFPAVIAIEIFNDTDSKSKGKRTIDANLGYGYRTNNGYKYAYFGKSSQDKGKFMIYPYSQEDIPPTQSIHKYSSSSSSSESHASEVEIQPSQAFELVKVNEQDNGYNYDAPSNPLKTKYESSETEKPAQTLYTTYNGQEFSGLSGQFPTLMPNYFVEPSQLLHSPQYQSVGLTQDHLRSQTTYVKQDQRIVPVLVLRVPSSYLKNPTAELYADLPKNYPLSQYLNGINLQEMVNQYFKKNGYPFAPRIMAYQNPQLVNPQTNTAHYANPYTSPLYTQADYSGLHYSAVQPVMAKYPGYTPQEYVSQPQPVYEQPAQQQYEYKYEYEPQGDIQAQAYYNQQKYAAQGNPESEVYQSQQAADYQGSTHDGGVTYTTSQQAASQDTKSASDVYQTQGGLQQTEAHVPNYASASPETPQYESINKEDPTKQAPSAEYGPAKASLPNYSSSSQYYSSQTAQKDSVSVYPSRLIHSEDYQVNPSPSSATAYTYSSQATGSSGISENYPSKDHTIATVIPYSQQNAVQTPQKTIQTVSYVTPIPNSKYQSQYRIMVPQTVLKSNIKTPSLNPQAAYNYLQQNYYSQSPVSEQSYRGSQSGHSTGSKGHPQTYYTYSKRMVKPSNKPVSSKTSGRKPNHKTSS